MTIQKYIELFKIYFIQNKALGGVFFIAVGIMLIVGAVKNWNWIFGDVSPVTYDLTKLDGIINIFGRKTARVFAGIGGVILILCGIAWTVACIWKSMLHR
ncbi:MAG: immunity 17 family protein [Dysgonomonas sp.]